MALFLVTAPTTEPVTLEDVRLHCKVETADDDPYLESLNSAATEHVETYIGRKCLEQTWSLTGHFPCGWRGRIVLPFPPVTAVTSITYLDTANVSQTWSSTNYRTSFPAGPQAAAAWIEPGYGVVYPSTYGVSDPVTVTFECGYGEATDVPKSVRHAIKLLVGHWFENRAVVSVGSNNMVSDIPTTIDALLWPYRAC